MAKLVRINGIKGSILPTPSFKAVVMQPSSTPFSGVTKLSLSITESGYHMFCQGYRNTTIIIMLLSVLFMVLSISYPLRIDKEIVITISKSGILISLLILALTKNKIEDELTFRIRLKAFAISFIFGVVYAIVEPFNTLLIKGNVISDNGVTGHLILMFLVYFMFFYLMLKKR